MYNFILNKEQNDRNKRQKHKVSTCRTEHLHPLNHPLQFMQLTERRRTDDFIDPFSRFRQGNEQTTNYVNYMKKNYYMNNMKNIVNPF